MKKKILKGILDITLNVSNVVAFLKEIKTNISIEDIHATTTKKFVYEKSLHLKL